MKTAISIPDELFERVEKGVAELGVSRSEFFARAAAAYLEDLERASLTAQINAALELIGDDDSWSDAVAASRRAMANLPDDEW